MAIDMTTAIVGAAVTGLTTPGYTLSADQALQTNARQSIVVGLTGTQTGVTSHAISDPFTLTVTKAKNPLVAPRPNPISGAVGPAGLNKISVKTRKGTKPLVGQSPQISTFQTDMSVIAGAEVNDIPNILALASAHIGLITREVNNLVTAIKTNSI